MTLDPIRVPPPDNDDRLDGVPVPADLARILASSPITPVVPLPLRLGDHELGWWVVEQVDVRWGKSHGLGYYVRMCRVEAPDGTVRTS